MPNVFTWISHHHVVSALTPLPVSLSLSHWTFLTQSKQAMQTWPPGACEFLSNRLQRAPGARRKMFAKIGFLISAFQRAVLKCMPFVYAVELTLLSNLSKFLEDCCACHVETPKLLYRAPRPRILNMAPCSVHRESAHLACNRLSGCTSLPVCHMYTGSHCWPDQFGTRPAFEPTTYDTHESKLLVFRKTVFSLTYPKLLT